MWIENVDLDDFGCFNRARMRGIDAGLTVVAGPQRAGKSTFMQALRHVGYGIPRGASLPPAADRYGVTADVVFDGDEYRISLDGHGDPHVTQLDGAPERSVADLYGGLPAAQYQQLYTISLDELRRDPEGLDDGLDLSSVLFTAAYGTTDVPDVRDVFEGRADEIGGVHGRDSYELSDPVETIERGVDARKEAVAQVAEHERVSQEKLAVADRIGEIESDLAKLRQERTRLEAIRENHETYRELEAIEGEIAAQDDELDDIDAFPVDRLERARRLQEAYEGAREARTERREAFRETAGDVDEEDAYCERLLDRGGEIGRYERELSRWRSQVEGLRETATELDRRRDKLAGRVSSLRADWAELDEVRERAVDTFSRGEVRNATGRVDDLRDDVAEHDAEIDRLTSRRDDLDARIEAAAEQGAGGTGRRRLVAAAGVIVASAIGGGLAVTDNALLAVGVTVAVLVVTGLYLLSAGDPATDDGVAIDTLRAQHEDVESRLESRRGARDSTEDELAIAESALDAIRSTYDLPEDADPTAVREFYTELESLSADVDEYDAAVAQYRAEREAVESTLAGIHGTLDELGVPGEHELSLDTAERTFSTVERVVEQYERAQEVRDTDRTVESVEIEIVDVLAAWEAIEDYQLGDDGLAAALDRFVAHGEHVEAARRRRRDRDRCTREIRSSLARESVATAFEPFRDDEGGDGDGDGVADDGDDGDNVSERDYREDAGNDGKDWLLDAFETAFETYGGIDAVEARLSAIDEETADLDDDLETKRQERADLKRELEDLASDEEVRDAHETIEAGRRELEPLLERYATNRIGEYLLDELHERFVDRTTGPLLDEASDVFEGITGGTYAGLASHDEFADLDFEAVLADGTGRRTAELSRATAEQLFLAVRIARIRRHDEPLPVLLDDSLTNFDPGHVDRTLAVLSELADQTQVFVLTCHPSLVDRVAATRTATYWCLDDGEFDGPHATPEPARELLAGTADSLGQDPGSDR